jgi:hypothetical protein
MAIDKLVPQYLNKDEDERLVKPFEMTDALNIRVSHEDGGDQGIIKNVEGNDAVSAATADDAIPSTGDNRVIGVVPCDAGKCIYFFLYNSELNHGIYRYDSVNNNYTKLYEDSVLNFERDGFVKGDVVINQFQEHLLYFTDNRNEPRKVNATRLLYGGYNGLMTSGTDEQKNRYLTVCKQPPQEVITWQFQTNSGIRANHLKENCFQFAYQYVYDDGEMSAMSAYSSLAVSNTNLAFNSAAIDYLESYNNELLLTVSNSDGPVTKIRVFARRNNDGAFQKIKEIDNDPTQAEQSFIFRNDKVYSYISDEEANKPYDAVPRAAMAQAVSNGRLIYGNYIEGFDNLVKTDVYNYPVYHPNTQAGSEVNLEVVNNEPMNETVIYADSGSDEFWENVASYYGGVRAKGFSVNNTYTAARYADSTTNGVSFDIDLSEFPVGGIDINGICSLDITIGCSQFGFASDLDSTASQTRLSLSAATYDDAGDEIHSQPVFILDPASDQQGVGNLVMSSPCQFVYQFNTTSYSTVNEFANVLVNEINNNAPQSVVGLSPKSNDYGQLLGATVMLAGTSGAQGSVVNSNEKDRLIAWMSGLGIFKLVASYNESSSKIVCKVVCTGVELSADTVVAPFHYGVNGIIGNDFVDALDINLPDYEQDNRGGCLGIASYHIYGGDKVNAIISSQENGSGYRLSDYSIGDGAIRSYWTNYSLESSTINIVSTDGDAVGSFKAGATHDFGIVYYDDRNRPSGVQPINERYVKHFGEDRQGNNGRTEIDLRILHDPPVWAKKWAPVYSKNTSYDKVLQVVVNEAATGKQTTFTDIRSNDGTKVRPITQGLEQGTNGQIFISMRGLEGKSNSYRDFKGAKLSYEFTEGDVLRILQYEDSNGSIQRPLHEFVITSYKYYSDDDQNPIRLGENSSDDDETNYRRTGWFLTVRDNNIPGFSRADVLIGKDKFSQNCLVEICTPKKESTEEARIYYELKKQYDIVDVGGVRTHAGDRSNGSSPVFSITVTSPTTFKSNQRLYLGDKLITANSNVFVAGIRPLQNGYFAYSVHAGNSFSQTDLSATGLVSASIDTTVGSGNSVHKGVVTLTAGDVFMRIREQLSNPQDDYTPSFDTSVTYLYNPTKPDNQLYRKWVVEDESVSDFFDSRATSIGRPFIETPDQKEIRRHTAITYSAPFVSDSTVLNLSSFNPVLYPYKDYNSKYGAICFLVDKGEGVLTMQEKKISVTPIGRQLIESSGEGMLVTSTNVLGNETYFAGSFGPGLNPESVVERFGVTYFCDMDAGKVFAISSNGIEPISDKSMSSFFEDLFAELLLRDSVPKIPCGIDPENDELIVTTESQDVNDIIIEGVAVGDVQKPPVNPRVSNPSGKVKAVYGSSNMMTWDKDSITWNDSKIEPVSYLPEWDSLGGSIMFVDKLTERGSVFIESSKRLSTSDVKVDILTSDGKYRGVGLINPADGSVSFPSKLIKFEATIDSTVSMSVTDGVDDDGNTVAYSTTKGFWMSLYSFNPEMYANLHNRFFSFENGQMYRHNVNDTNNNFYGTQYDSKVTLISRVNPSMIKVYNAISLEGNDNWAATISNSTQTTEVTEAMFETKEGLRYSVIPKDTSSAVSDSSGSNIVELGVVTSLSGVSLNEIGFDGRISNLPFGIGDEIRILNSASTSTTGLTISEVLDRKTIRVSGSGVGLFGQTLIAVSNSNINGDHIRDYYAKVELTNDNTNDVELYAVNLSLTPSPMHNEQES